jgi:putative endonuclease
MENRRAIGNRGEEIAAGYLERNGYTILDRNWRWGRQEIDIIAKKAGFLVIVEVKSRDPAGPEEPEQAVTLQKQRILTAAANAYVRYRDIDLEVRFDVIGILYKASGPEIRHIEDAFGAGLERRN